MLMGMSVPGQHVVLMPRCWPVAVDRRGDRGTGGGLTERQHQGGIGSRRQRHQGENGAC